ncbi:transcriptional regulator, TetR family [Granulicella pectinivorans]|jgi:AcrR family transcriptional regulator|uniref:Transcriptional regulator, TetR family n=1 Tax=Granulicella pectinivorans TaxID=474950 RepID=A0A1I6MZB1_9BACT|nr:TetR/AcrR family transcriptional regulator C-terminal domain-containing protein [Granulicella pectinivorans]SFS21026.1 transcriptional regulator, TetR family [Granulicella pectinivorans]
MKVNKKMVVQAGLKLLNEVGLEQLTLRRLATQLDVQAPTIYWHFKSKQELIDDMATMVLAEGAPNLTPARNTTGWKTCAATFGHGLRKTLLAYRDGARMVAGTELTDTAYMKTAESIAAKLLDHGFTVRQAVVLLSTIYSYTLSFVMEEQAVYPRPNERSPRYDLKLRSTRLDPHEFPILRQAGPILFDKFDRRYKEGLDLILRGAEGSAA